MSTNEGSTSLPYPSMFCLTSSNRLGVSLSRRLRDGEYSCSQHGQTRRSENHHLGQQCQTLAAGRLSHLTESQQGMQLGRFSSVLVQTFLQRASHRLWSWIASTPSQQHYRCCHQHGRHNMKAVLVAVSFVLQHPAGNIKPRI
jgi:hypothetical protein